MPEYTITATCGTIVSAESEDKAKDLFFNKIEDGDITILDKTIKVIEHP